MPAALTPVVARTAIQKPVGSDVFSLAAINGMAQAIADRTEWASKGLIVPYSKIVDMDDEDYPDNPTTFATVTDGTVTASQAITVSVGDIVWLRSNGIVDLNQNAGSATVQARMYDGAEALSNWAHGRSDYAEDGVDTVTMDLDAIHVVTVAGTKTFSLQTKRSGTITPIGRSLLYFSAIHYKLGAA